MSAQLRDVLAAEDSTPMTQESNNRRLLGPERTEKVGLAVDVRQFDGR
jgi:hypothetical protein